MSRKSEKSTVLANEFINKDGRINRKLCASYISACPEAGICLIGKPGSASVFDSDKGNSPLCLWSFAFPAFRPDFSFVFFNDRINVFGLEIWLPCVCKLLSGGEVTNTKASVFIRDRQYLFVSGTHRRFSDRCWLQRWGY